MIDKPHSVIISGAGGQLGQELMVLSSDRPFVKMHFFKRTDLDITDQAHLSSLLKNFNADFFINCAAYTAVDKAEDEYDKAFDVNANACKYIARACVENSCKLIHISTDYVYDNGLTRPLKESDPVQPKSVYALSKLKGEQYIREILPEHVILRCSWIFSSFGSNFVKTMLRLFDQRDELKIVNDQIGTPSYARDIAYCIYSIIEKMIDSDERLYGTYNFSNEGSTNWYEYAQTILELSGKKCSIHPISSEEFGAKASRPSYSVLDKTKIKKSFDLGDIPDWKDSLAKCITQLIH